MHIDQLSREHTMGYFRRMAFSSCIAFEGFTSPWKLQLDVPPILSKPIYLQVMNCFHPVKFCYGGSLVYIGTV